MTNSTTTVPFTLNPSHLEGEHFAWLWAPQDHLAVLEVFPYNRFVFTRYPAGPKGSFKQGNPPEAQTQEYLDAILPDDVIYQYWDIYWQYAFRYEKGNPNPIERAPCWDIKKDTIEYLEQLCQAAQKSHFKTIVLIFRTMVKGIKTYDIFRIIALKYPDVAFFVVGVKVPLISTQKQYIHIAIHPACWAHYCCGVVQRTYEAMPPWVVENKTARGARPLESKAIDLFINAYTDQDVDEFRSDYDQLVVFNFLNMLIRVARVGRFDPFDRQVELLLALADPENFASAFGITHRPKEALKDTYFKPAYGPPGSTDRFLCDSCSLAPKCTSYRREGGLCTVDESLGELVALLGSRDVEEVQTGLSRIIQIQANRYVKTAQAWDGTVDEIRDEDFGKRIQKSKHLLEMENSVTKSVENLIKLMDPSKVGGGPQIAILNQNGGAVTSGTPSALAADVVRALEAKGIAREDITEEAVRSVLGGESEVAEGEIVD